MTMTFETYIELDVALRNQIDRYNTMYAEYPEDREFWGECLRKVLNAQAELRKLIPFEAL